MKELTPEEHFRAANALAKKEYNLNKAMGKSGHLTSLEGLLKDVEIVSTVNLGIIEIPLKKIVGTYSTARRNSFAKNFMPLMPSHSEFEDKWVNLCNIHLSEGIRDPVKVYEYMNWFYVIEGNKRVSLLKYFDAYSVQANIIRLIPKKDNNDVNNLIYYEFLEFNKVTKLSCIWFSKRRRFTKLLNLLSKYNPQDSMYDSKYKHFEVYVYNTFSKVFHELGGDKLKMTTGDALLEYVKIYGIPDKMNSEELRLPLSNLMKEFEIRGNMDIQTEFEKSPRNLIFSKLTNILKSTKKLKIAFVYARTIEGSGWTYSHELGRQHISKIFESEIETHFVENVPENNDAYYEIKKLAEDNFDVIFTTSEVFMNATIRCSLEYPHIRFFNCSESKPYIHISNYFGRTYEPRFLAGIIAGAMTKSNIIGYAATSPTSEVISCINAFTLGCKMVNPFAVVKVVWTNEWNNPSKSTDACKVLIDSGADMVCNKNLIVPRKVTQEYGVYSMLCSIDPVTKDPANYLAAPIWKWGDFYEKIISNVLSGTYIAVTNLFNDNPKLINFWWGMSSGVMDLYFSQTHVPIETQKTVMLFKKMIVAESFNPFSGPLYNNNGDIIIEKDEVLTPDDILNMKWFVKGVEAEEYIEQKK